MNDVSATVPTPRLGMDIPAVHLADALSGDAERRAAFVATLGNAMKEYGFVRVLGHDVNPALVQPAYEAAKAFFALSDEQKSAYIVPNGAGQRGYTTFGAEHAKDSPMPDLKEFWHVGRELEPGHAMTAVYPPNLWPSEVPELRPRTLALYNSLEAVSNVLLEGLAEWLGLPANALRELTDDGNTILRLLHYPPLAEVDAVPGAVRAGAHEDINFITLLVTSTAGGLELLRRDGAWVGLNTAPGEILADIGDMLSRITNGVLPATTHRVVNPDAVNTDRFSMPFFVHPRPEAVLRVFDCCRGPGLPEAPPDITGEEFLAQRLREIGLM